MQYIIHIFIRHTTLMYILQMHTTLKHMAWTPTQGHKKEEEKKEECHIVQMTYKKLIFIILYCWIKWKSVPGGSLTPLEILYKGLQHENKFWSKVRGSYVFIPCEEFVCLFVYNGDQSWTSKCSISTYTMYPSKWRNLKWSGYGLIVVSCAWGWILRIYFFMFL